MPNKIDPTMQRIISKTADKIGGAVQNSVIDRGKTPAASSEVAKSGSGDTVLLTERSQLLGNLEKSIAEMPVIDRARVEAVKADIQEGNYEIDTDNLADILMQSDFDLGE